MLTNEVSEVESSLQDFSSEEEVVGGRIPSFPARSNTSKHTSTQNLRAERAFRGGGSCAEREAEAQSRCRLAQLPAFTALGPGDTSPPMYPLVLVAPFPSQPGTTFLPPAPFLSASKVRGPEHE